MTEEEFMKMQQQIEERKKTVLRLHLKDNLQQQ
jgi:hypothetical protein